MQCLFSGFHAAQKTCVIPTSAHCLFEAEPRLCQNSVGQLPPTSFLGRTDGSAVTFDGISITPNLDTI